MFKILTMQRDGEGINRHLSPVGYEKISFAAIEEAVEVLWRDYGHGMVVLLDGQHVLSL